MKRVVLSSTSSDTYNFFLLIAAKVWELRIGYEPCILLVGDRQEWRAGRCGVVLRNLELFGYEVTFVDRVPGVSDANVSMAVRQHAAALPGLDPQDLLMVGDVDLLPIRKEFYHQHQLDHGPVAIHHADMYKDTYWPAYGPSMTVQDWRELMGLTEGDLRGSLERSFQDGKIKELIEAQKADYKDSRLWTFDEEYASLRIRESRFSKHLLKFSSREEDRLCRNSWPTTVYTSKYIDCHCPRPGWSSEGWSKIRPVLAQILPEELEWFDWYRDQYCSAAPAGHVTSADRADRSNWDSEVFGCWVGLLDLKDRPFVRSSVEDQNSEEFEVVFVKADGWQTPEGVTALDYSYDMELSGAPRKAATGSKIFAWPAPSPAHIRIARSAFSDSRFHRDPKLASKTPDLYQKWLEGAKATYTLANYPEDAFVSVTRDPDGAARISLVGVSENNRGSGLGSALLLGVWDRLADLKPWRVRVSARNSRAIRFYESLGFCVKSTQTAFHVWMKREG